jgi:chorismate dehydratase
MSLTVGHITYLNCVPFFHHLPAVGFRGEIVSGVPSRLNQLLAAGELDVSPSSSFEYAQHWRDYLLLPNLSISSRGPVQSVLLLSSRPLAELHDVEITLTGESATSVRLLQVLFKEFLGFPEVSCRVAEAREDPLLNGSWAALLIGDRALRAAVSSKAPFVTDLGELWYQYTGLPFVFALWIVRRQSVLSRRAELGQLLAQLQWSLQRSQADFAVLAAALRIDWLSDEQLLAYWRSMSYELTAEHLQGLRLFFALCVKHRLLAEEPELHFFRGERETER